MSDMEGKVLTAKEDGWPKLRARVMNRDGGCVAQMQGVSGLCRDRFGNPLALDNPWAMELDHVPEHARFRKAPDDEAHLQVMCGYHHETWATSKLSRELSRTRLAVMYPEAWRQRDSWDS